MLNRGTYMKKKENWNSISTWPVVLNLGCRRGASEEPVKLWCLGPHMWTFVNYNARNTETGILLDRTGSVEKMKLSLHQSCQSFSVKGQIVKLFQSSWVMRLWSELFNSILLYASSHQQYKNEWVRLGSNKSKLEGGVDLAILCWPMLSGRIRWN